MPNLGEHLPPQPLPEYELDNAPRVSLATGGDNVPRTVTPNQWANNYMPPTTQPGVQQGVQQAVVPDDEHRAVEEAMRRSEQDLRAIRRTDTGTDLNELELAYKLSLGGQ